MKVSDLLDFGVGEDAQEGKVRGFLGFWRQVSGMVNGLELNKAQIAAGARFAG